MRLLIPFLLAAAAAPLAAQDAPALPQPESGATLLELSARGEVTRVPDVALINAGVVTQAPDAAAAIRENAARMARIVSALERAGVAKRDIQTATINLMPQYRYGENQPPAITGYQAANSLNIRFRDIGRAGAILDALVESGANQVSGPELTLDRPEAAMDEARRSAVAKARARAELYAAAAGLRVARILSISESAAPIRPQPVLRAQSFDMAEAASSKVLPGEQTIGADLLVRFELR